jgi:predicted DNA-binding protein with PD1-like motif
MTTSLTRTDAEPEAPRFHSVEARPHRIIVGRLLPGADLIGGLEDVCDRHGLRYAAVSFAYGSLSSAGFKTLQVTAKSAPRAVLTLTTVDRRVEFLAGQGLICDNGETGRATHLHGSISDETGQVLGGHFEPGLNPVYNNMDFTLTELLGVRLSRTWDAETDTVEMVVQQWEDDDQ